MKNRTSGRFSCNHLCTGWKPANIGAQTGSVCLFASSAKPIVGVCDEPMPPTILAISDCPRAPPARALSSQIQLLVERDAVLAAVGLVMVHEPPHVDRLDEIATLVVELDRPL